MGDRVMGCLIAAASSRLEGAAGALLARDRATRVKCRRVEPEPDPGQGIPHGPRATGTESRVTGTGI
jgi:hypothetical protein